MTNGYDFKSLRYCNAIFFACAQQPDKFNRTHTVYVTTKENVEEPKTTTPKISKPKSTKKEKS